VGVVWAGVGSGQEISEILDISEHRVLLGGVWRMGAAGSTKMQ
jgi:hypothetical protein